jgi:hypothetical protein
MTTVLLRNPLGDAIVVAAKRASAAEQAAALDRRGAAFWLRAHNAGGFDARTLARLCELAYGHAFGFGERTGVSALLERRVEEAIDSGRLLVLAQRRRRVVVPLDAPMEVLGPDEEPKSWIEIELVDDAGRPVPDEEYCIHTGDGRVRSGTLDASGRAREDGIDPGTCQVTFPRLRSWRAA